MKHLYIIIISLLITSNAMSQGKNLHGLVVITETWLIRTLTYSQQQVQVMMMRAQKLFNVLWTSVVEQLGVDTLLTRQTAILLLVATTS